jgi:hypothetical protein
MMVDFVNFFNAFRAPFVRAFDREVPSLAPKT